MRRKYDDDDDDHDDHDDDDDHSAAADDDFGGYGEAVVSSRESFRRFGSCSHVSSANNSDSGRRVVAVAVAVAVPVVVLLLLIVVIETMGIVVKHRSMLK